MTRQYSVTAWPGLGATPEHDRPLLGASSCDTAPETTSAVTSHTFLTD
ncbi:hypothetical protein [Microbacterium sp.]|jgi:hypothetical protein